MGKILLIDDEVDIRGFMQMFFEDRGFEIDIAEDGLQGVEKFKLNQYDLILSDMMMPGMLGLDVLRHIKQVKPEQKVILITGVKEKSMVQKAMELGCQHYLNKPFNLKELESIVDKCLADPV
jgi:DNA-binding response OmpR family regulator